MATKNVLQVTYDPQRDGYDTTVWKTITGSPAVGSNQLGFNAATGITYYDFDGGAIEMMVTVPAAPTGGDSRQFGFSFLNKGAFSYFDITGAVFSCKVSDGEGNSDSATVTWNAAWTNTATKFEIRQVGAMQQFFINGTKVATLSDPAKTPRVPMAVYVKNGNADVLNLKYFIGSSKNNIQ